jgi:xanthine/CO dehydrogenase XdhC/CoxF family maturation factor
MGCRGIVRILLEPFDNENIMQKVFQTVLESRERRFIGTVISSNGDSSIGERIFHSKSEQFNFQNVSNQTKSFSELQSDIQSFFEQNSDSEVREYKIGDKSFEMFFENINPPLNLLLFGVGYDALPLINFAKEIGWRVTAIDHRPAFANAERLPGTDEVIVSSSEDLSVAIFNDENSVGVIMTHNYERDRNILRRLLHSKCKYIGALGPKKRTEKLLEEIGENFSAEQLLRLHAPVGLDIGADSPEAIALSIVAEIQSVLSERKGGFLRDRKGSIYARD